MPTIKIGRVVGPQGPQGNIGPVGPKGDPAYVNGKGPNENGEIFLIPPDIGAASNPNLLDNWYLADPINQRGKTEYIGYRYTIDRFFAWDNTTLTITKGGVSLSGNFIEQMQSDALREYLTGKTVTLSALVKGDSGEIGELNGSNTHFPASEQFFVSQHTFTYQAGAERYAKQPYIHTNGTTIIFAMKLEIGAQQTLAHQDLEGNWVLNDPPPDKWLELAKCQRYLQSIIIAFKNDTYRDSLRDANIYITFNYPMRAAPTLLNLSDIVYSPSFGYGGWRSDGTITVEQTKQNFVHIKCALPENSSFNASEIRIVSKGSKNGELGPVLLSAEL